MDYVFKTMRPEGIQAGTQKHFIFMWNMHVPDTGVELDDMVGLNMASSLLRALQQDCICGSWSMLTTTMVVPKYPTWESLCWVLDDTITKFMMA